MEPMTRPRKMMIKNKSIITGSIILFLSYSLWYLFHHYWYNYWVFWLPVKFINVYGNWIAYTLLFYGIGKIHTNKKAKWFIFYYLSFFFGSRLVFSIIRKYLQYIEYEINKGGAIDILLNNNAIINHSIIAGTICILWFFYQN